jgi:predicted ATPase/DNA-binding SARP family transcriptional activator
MRWSLWYATRRHVATADADPPVIQRADPARGSAQRGAPTGSHSHRAVDLLSISLLGEFGVRAGRCAVEPREWRLRKAAMLVKALALAPGHQMHRDQVADLLWPSFDAAAAMRNLAQTVYIARSRLGRDPDGQTVLPLRGDTLVLGTPACPVSVDVDAFRAAAAAARASGEADRYREALALYAGDLLPDDRNVEWVVTARDELRAELVELLMDLARAEGRAGLYPDAIRTLRRAVRTDPLNEDAHGALIRMRAAAGDRRGAVEEYERLRDALRRELGVEPDHETRDLYETLVRGGTPAPAVDDEAPARPPEGPAPLPLHATSFLGRDLELRAVRRLLGSARLLTLTGPGGVGKTRLAVRAAEEPAPPGRMAWFVDLAAVADPRLVAPAIAGALGVVVGPDHSPIDAVSAHVGAAPALLVLDNAEHVLAAVAEAVGGLLARCPRLRLLVTSRQRLGVEGEHVWPIAPFEVPPGDDASDPEALERFDAVRLFVARARAVQPGFALTSRNAHDVLRICRGLDGMPLAIELAAARADVLSAGQIAARLADALRLLARRGAALPARQRTLVGAMSWSTDLLSEAQQTLFQRLAVFVGGFDLEAVEAVCRGGSLAGADALDLITDLVERSLVLTEPRPDGVTMRYRQLETLRQFGAEQLRTAGELPAASAAHAAYYLGLAERGQSVLGFTETAPGEKAPTEQAQWVERLAREHGNLRAALTWAIEHDPELALRLGSALHRFWWMKGHLTEGILQLSRALAAGRESAAPTRALALYSVANLALARSDYDAVRRFMDEALRLCASLGDHAGAARAHQVLGAAANWNQEHDRAEVHLASALRIRQEIGDELGVGETLYETAILAHFRGDHPRAAAILGRIEPIAAAVGDARSISYVALMAGRAALGSGRRDDAGAAFARALALLAELADGWGMWMCLDGLSHLAAAENEPARALTLAGAAARTRDLIGAPLPPAFRHENDQRLAAARLRLSDPDAAAAWSAGYALDTTAAAEYAAAGLSRT